MAKRPSVTPRGILKRCAPVPETISWTSLFGNRKRKKNVLSAPVSFMRPDETSEFTLFQTGSVRGTPKRNLSPNLESNSPRAVPLHLRYNVSRGLSLPDERHQEKAAGRGRGSRV